MVDNVPVNEIGNWNSVRVFYIECAKTGRGVKQDSTISYNFVPIAKGINIIDKWTYIQEKGDGK